MTFTINVPMIPPSPNAIKRQYRNHHAYKKLRSTWENSLFIATGSAALAREIRTAATLTRKMNVTITVMHKGSYDPDNLTGSVKVVLDAMRNIGFLRNDRAKDIELHVNQDRAAIPETIIILSPNLEVHA